MKTQEITANPRILHNLTGYLLSDVDNGFSSLVRLPVRFLKKIKFRTDGCWEWTGSTHHHQRFRQYAYGQFSADGTSRSITGAHRYAYEATKGRIPEGLEIDHKCKNKLCVNPAHLRAVTHKENCATRHKRGRVAGSIRWWREHKASQGVTL